MKNQVSTKQNNFDFLRLFAAYLVLFSHQFALTGRPEPMRIGAFQDLGGLGVCIFFSISGYLVAQSWDRDPSAPRFVAKRLLRILPGLIVVTVSCAVLLGPLVSTLALRQYFSSPKTWEFFHLLKLSGVSNELPGVFTANPYPNAVDGSLWTLSVEARCYLILMVLGVIGVLRRPRLLLVGTIAFAVYVFVIHDAEHSLHPKHNLEYGAFFFSAACLYYFRQRWAPRPGILLASLAAAGAVLVAVDHAYLALLLTLPAFAIVSGTTSTPFMRRAGRFGDLSYGIYIYAFPVQQTVVFLTSNRLSIWTALLTTTLITAALALLSWHYVERPALRLKRYFEPTGNLFSETSLSPEMLSRVTEKADF